MKKVRIGSGAGYAGDRIEPAIDLINKGNLDYIIFECLAERTIALAQLQKLKDSEKGYNPMLEERMEKILESCIEKKVKVITNMGAANPLAAIKLVKRIAENKGLNNIKIAAVLGDDVLSVIRDYTDYPMIETGRPLQEVGDAIISANSYIGLSGIVEALKNGADIIITGRVADPSLTVAPLFYEFGWDEIDYELLGKATACGHLLECGAQVSGGYFADPGYKDVSNLWNVGFPIAEVQEDGEFFITKLEESGGMITPETVKEQIVYEIHDPANYYTPDVVADFSLIEVKELEKDKVGVYGVTGKEKTGTFKTSIGYKDGFIVEAEISYGGPGCVERVKLAEEIIRKRLEIGKVQPEELRIDFIGLNSLYKNEISTDWIKNEQIEVRMRVAARTKNRNESVTIGQEVEALYTNGPAGGGGVRIHIEEVISIASILLLSSQISIHVEYEEV